MDRIIKDSIKINAEISDVFESLITPSQILKWWGATTAIVLPENDGIYAVTWGSDIDDPDYRSISTIKEIIEPSKLHLVYGKYSSKFNSLPFEASLEVIFTLEQADDETDIQVIQTGIPIDPIADEFYAGCVKGWRDTLSSFKKTIEEAV